MDLAFSIQYKTIKVLFLKKIFLKKYYFFYVKLIVFVFSKYFGVLMLKIILKKIILMYF